MLETLIKLPLILFVLVWNGVFGILNFVLGMTFALIHVLAPFAGLALLFVSNEKEAQEVMSAKWKPPAVSTPADGELFSKMFEENAEVQKIFMKDDTIVVVDEDIKKKGYLLVNVYQLKTKDLR